MKWFAKRPDWIEKIGSSCFLVVLIKKAIYNSINGSFINDDFANNFY
jgi:hypothetical protein